MEDSPQQKLQQHPPEFITKGSLVEVCSEEEGFTGAWFVATVVSPSPSAAKKKKTNSQTQTQKPKVYVEYKTLCADEKLSSLLREHVDVQFVRPLPPTEDDNQTMFELYDVVDAYYRDGWWTGVITRVYEKSRFVVTFSNPADELEFGFGDLRLHHDWVNHSWVKPPKQKIPGLMFGEGKRVEASIKIKHNQDVWYPGTIVENHTDSSFLVEYQTLKEGTDETESQKVTVDFSHIRPSPPRVKDRFFDLLEKVDAYHEFGWWSGLITKALPDNRYTVFFPITKRDGEFDHANIRPQLNWKDGKWWFTSSQEEVIPCHENPADLVDSELNDTSSGKTLKTEVISKGKKTKQKVPDSSGSREIISSKKLSNNPQVSEGVLERTNLQETEFPSSSLGENQTDHVELGHKKSRDVASSSKKANHIVKIKFRLQEKPKKRVSTSSQQNTAMTRKGKGGRPSGSPPSNVPRDTMLIDLTSQDQLSDNPSWETRTPKKRKKMDATEKHTFSSRKKLDQAGEEGNNGFTNGAEHVERDSRGKEFTYGAEHVERDSRGKEVGKAFILGLECCKSSSSKAGKTLSNGEETLMLEGGQKKQVINLPEQGKRAQSEAGKNNHKRKRCRPKKVSAGSVNAEMSEQKRVPTNDDSIIKYSSMSEVDSHVTPDSLLMSMRGLLPAENYPMPIGDCLKLVYSQSNDRNDSGSNIRKSSSRMPTDTSDQAISSEHERRTKKAKRRTSSENKISQTLDSSDGTVAMTSEPFCITKEVIRTVRQEPGMLDDQPLSTWFEKMHSPGIVNSSRDSTAMREQSIELRQKNKELNGQTTPAKDHKTDAVMIEEVDTQNHVLVDGDTMVEQSVKLKQSRKELNDLTNLPKDKTAVFMSATIDERSPALVNGNTRITTTGEPELPFVKSSSLWTIFESMDAFRKMPQKPHFRPLQQCKESSREGYAIAFMVNFSSAVEKISCLRFDDSQEKIDDILDSLEDLESHGFRVQVLRDRITELESIKEKHKNLYEEVDGINKQILCCNFDKYDQDKEIRDMTTQLKQLQERIAKAESIKELKDHELAVLESRHHEAEESIGRARSRYEGLVAGVL